MSFSLIQTSKELETANSLLDMSNNVISNLLSDKSDQLNLIQSFPEQKPFSCNLLMSNKLKYDNDSINLNPYNYFDTNNSNHSDNFHDKDLPNHKSPIISEINKCSYVDYLKGMDIVGDLVTDQLDFTEDELVYGRRILIELMDSSNRLYNSQFLDAVDENDAPLYYEKIEQPMWLRKILEKFDLKQYKSILEFSEDFKLMINNSIKYNGYGHPVSKKAKKLEIMFYQKLNLLPSIVKDKFKVKLDKTQVPQFQKVKTVLSAERIAILRRQRKESAQRIRAKKLHRMEVLSNSRILFYETLQIWEDDLLKGCLYKSLWQLPQIGLYLKSTLSSLKIQITQFELERCFLLPQQSLGLAQIMTALLNSHNTRKQMNEWNVLSYEKWHEKLKTTLTPWFKAYNENGKDTDYVFQKFGIEKELFDIFGKNNPLISKNYEDLSYEERVWILKSLCDFTLENQKAMVEAIDELTAETHRPTTLGYDSEGFVYIYFHQFIESDIRIYKQTYFHSKIDEISDDLSNTKDAFMIKSKFKDDDDYDSLEQTDDSQFESSSENLQDKDDDFKLSLSGKRKLRSNIKHVNTKRINTRSAQTANLVSKPLLKSNNILESQNYESGIAKIGKELCRYTAKKIDPLLVEQNQNIYSTPRRSLRKVMEESKRDITFIKKPIREDKYTNKSLINCNKSNRQRNHLERNLKFDKTCDNNILLDQKWKFKKNLRILNNRNLKDKLKTTFILNRNPQLKCNKINFCSKIPDSNLDNVCNSKTSKITSRLKKSKSNKNSSNTEYKIEESYSSKNENLIQLNKNFRIDEVFELVVENLDDLKKLINQLIQKEDSGMKNLEEEKLLKNLENLYSDLLPFESQFQQIIKKKKVDMRRQMEKYERGKKMQLLKENQLKRQQSDEEKLKPQACDVYSDDMVIDQNKKENYVKIENFENENEQNTIKGDGIYKESVKMKFKKSIFEPGEILEKRTRFKRVTQPLVNKANKSKRSTRSTNAKYNDDYAYDNHPFFSDSNYVPNEMTNRNVQSTNAAIDATKIEIKNRFISKRSKLINSKHVKLSELNDSIKSSNSTPTTLNPSTSAINTTSNFSTTINLTYNISKNSVTNYTPYIPNLIRNKIHNKIAINNLIPPNGTLDIDPKNYVSYSVHNQSPSTPVNNSYSKLMDKTILSNFHSQMPLGIPNTQGVTTKVVTPDSHLVSSNDNIQFVDRNKLFGQPLSITSLNTLINNKNQNNKVIFLNSLNTNNPILLKSSRNTNQLVNQSPVFLSNLNNQITNQHNLKKADCNTSNFTQSMINHLTVTQTPTNQPILYFVKSPDMNPAKQPSIVLSNTNNNCIPLNSFLFSNTPISINSNNLPQKNLQSNIFCNDLSINNTANTILKNNILLGNIATQISILNTTNNSPLKTVSNPTTILLPQNYIGLSNKTALLPNKFISNLKSINSTDATALSNSVATKAQPLEYIGSLTNLLSHSNNTKNINDGIETTSSYNSSNIGNLKNLPVTNLINLANIRKLYFTSNNSTTSTNVNMTNNEDTFNK